MRLRELTFPIAVKRPNLLMGGINAGLSKVSHYDFNVAEFYEDGGYDESVIYDSDGREFAVEKIYFSKPAWWHYVLRRLDNLVILPIQEKSDMVSVDMELKEIRQLSLGEFCNELRALALENPSWWKRHSSQKEIEEMFQGCNTFAEAINDIGILDPPGKEKLPGKSGKIVDLR